MSGILWPRSRPYVHGEGPEDADSDARSAPLVLFVRLMSIDERVLAQPLRRDLPFTSSMDARSQRRTASAAAADYWATTMAEQGPGEGGSELADQEGYLDWAHTDRSGRSLDRDVETMLEGKYPCEARTFKPRGLRAKWTAR